MWPFSRKTRHAEAAPATTTTVSYMPAASVRSYDRSPLLTNQYIAETADLALYQSIVNGIPFIDVALRKLARMVAPFDIACDNDATKAALDQWCEAVPVSYVMQGFSAFLRPHIRQCLTFGRSAGEVVLAQNRRDVAGLFVVDAQSIRLIKAADGQLVLGQVDARGQATAFENQELFVYTALNNEGDNPQGVSLLRSLPFVADIALRMENAVRQKWQRHGAPSFLVHHKIDPGVSIPDAGVAEIQSSLQTAWQRAMTARWNNEGIIDFVAASQGDLSATAIDSAGELEFVQTFRTMVEQIVSTVELAPFMLGLQWSTTERLSQQQADAIIAQCDDIRHELEPDVLQILDWVQRTRGLRGEVSIKWHDVSLQDRTETAKADLLEQQAGQLKRKNAEWGWRNGATDQTGALQEAGYDIETPLVRLEAPVGVPSVPTGAAGAEAVAEALWRGYP